jgi:hypothetical protein
MSLLNKAENIGFTSVLFHKLKIFLYIFLGILFPIGIVVNILSVLRIAGDITNVIGTIIIVILVIVPLIINSVLTIKALVAIRSGGTGGNLIKKVKLKTIFLIVASFVLILNFVIQIITFGWYGAFYDVIIIRKYMSLFVEVVIASLFWCFLQNVIKTKESSGSTTVTTKSEKLKDASKPTVSATGGSTGGSKSSKNNTGSTTGGSKSSKNDTGSSKSTISVVNITKSSKDNTWSTKDSTVSTLSIIGGTVSKNSTEDV